MTSSSLPFRTGTGPLSYARSRLYLGITGVGTAVLAATALLVFDIPARGFATTAEQSVGRGLFAIGLYFALLPALFFLFDLMGGAWVVRRKQWAQLWLSRWLRGVAVQWAVWMITAAALMLSTRAGGVGAAIATFVVIQCVLAASRGPLARVVAQLPVTVAPPALQQAATRAGIAAQSLVVLDATDEGFVGGWSGIRPRTLYVPLRWATLPPAALEAQLARRQLVATSGAHTRGVLGAIVWNTLGLLVVLLVLRIDLATAAGIVRLGAGMTLWAFLGVLLLPTPSRAAVYAIDAAVSRTHSAAALAQSIELLDKWQDDEAQRAPTVERIFHPVPARANRILRLQAAHQSVNVRWHSYHVARQALWLAWGAMTPLSRVVHCNVGRTELWAMLPGD